MAQDRLENARVFLRDVRKKSAGQAKKRQLELYRCESGALGALARNKKSCN
jgi:hypothetical protein